jgi:hypothetical protein
MKNTNIHRGKKNWKPHRPAAAGAAPFQTRHPVRLAYQPPASSTFLSQQTNQQYSSLRTN